MKELNELDDRTLMERFVSGGMAEWPFREIIRRYKKKVYWQVRRLTGNHDDADEVAQLVFIKLWKSAASFRFDSALSSFIYKIAYNESISLLKKKNRFVSFDDLTDNDRHLDGHSTDGHEADAIEIGERLEKAIGLLPEKQRLVFQYRYFDELSYAQISEITGTSEGALKASYHFAAEKIKTSLREI